MDRRPALIAAGAGLAFLAVLVIAAIGAALGPARSGGASGSGSSPSGGGASGPATSATPAMPVPTPGQEVYGFLPYWEMDATIADHVAGTDLTTLALFSVTNRKNGTLDTSQRGYQRIAGPIGARLIREAHARGVRVELVFTSFGSARNRQLFGGPLATQDRVIASLVTFARSLGVDGIDVDVEGMPATLVDAYAAFVGRLRSAVLEWRTDGQVSVATQANQGGATLAAAAAAAGADRVFLMGYDYRVAASQPGATAPLDRNDGEVKDLAWSLDLYRALGVPVERTILGLPLYGLSWPVTGPEVAAPATGKGAVWIPSDHLDVLRDAALVPVRDPIEQVEVYTIGGPGPTSAPATVTPAASGSSESPAPADWTVIYVDSPETLTPKIALSQQRGLAGVGFWAIGYERGVSGYTELIRRFRAGEVR